MPRSTKKQTRQMSHWMLQAVSPLTLQEVGELLRRSEACLVLPGFQFFQFLPVFPVFPVFREVNFMASPTVCAGNCL
jgi:hypothetical protein